LRTEQEEYASEGIQWVPVQYFDNKIVCDLFESKQGLVGYLDEVSVMHTVHMLFW